MDKDLLIIDRQHLQSLVPKVLEKLNSLAEMPKYGTVAGQAVASVFQEVLNHPASGPINDIDIFVNKDLPRSLRGRKRPANITNRNRKQRLGDNNVGFSAVSESQYNHVKIIVARSNLLIKSTYRDGLINYTIISPSFSGSKKWSHDSSISQSIVEGFDLNLVGVGINLESGQVVATDEYLDFLRTSQIRVKTCITPMHTLIRLAHKISSGQFEGVSCDYAHERALLEAAIYCQTELIRMSSTELKPGETRRSVFTSDLVATFGSGKYQKMYEENPDVLPPIRKFDADDTVEKEQTGGYRLNTLQVQRPQHPNVQPLVDYLINASIPFYLQHQLLCSDFPKLYDLFVLPCLQQRERQEMFLSINANSSTTETIHQYSRAIGKQASKPSDVLLGDVDTAVFFFNQHHSATPELQKKAIDACNNTPVLPRSMFFGLDKAADTFVEFSENPDDVWNSMLMENPRSLFKELSDYTHHQPAHEEIANLTVHLLGLSKLLPKTNKDEVARVLLGALSHPHLDAHTPVPLLPDLLSCFPASKQLDLGLGLIRQLAPSWPNVAGVSQEDRTDLMRVWTIVLGQDITPELFSAVQPDYRGYCVKSAIELFISEFNRLPSSVPVSERAPLYSILLPDLNESGEFSGDKTSSSKMKSFLNTALPLLSGEEFREQNGKLIFILFQVMPADDILDHLSSRSCDPIMDDAIGECMAVLSNLFPPDERESRLPEHLEQLSYLITEERCDQMMSAFKRFRLSQVAKNPVNYQEPPAPPSSRMKM